MLEQGAYLELEFASEADGTVNNGGIIGGGWLTRRRAAARVGLVVAFVREQT